MKRNHKSKVINNIKIAKGTYKLSIQSDIEKVKAGQFLSILCNNKTLRRPFSISGYENGIIEILYKLKGEGTEFITNLKPDDDIEFLAPLGNGFDVKNVQNALLIGAGIGIAPVLFLKKVLSEKNIKNYLITGFKSEQEKIEGSDKTIIGGSVLDNIDELINEIKPDMIYSCGPSIVLKKISDTGIKHKIKTQIAMEKVMACSIGVCRGCTIELKDGTNKTVCKDGPVFMGDEILWRI